MGLNANTVYSLGGGGGNYIGGANPIEITTAQPRQGDFLLMIVQASFGLNTPTPQQPTFTVTDDAGNIWKNVFDIFEPQASTEPYIGQYSISVWICESANGKTIGHFDITSTVVEDAYDVTGLASYSDWFLPYNGIESHSSKIIGSATDTPTADTFAITHDQLVIAIFNTLGVALGDDVSAGFTVLNNPSSGGYLDAYVVRPLPGENTPGLTALESTSPWLLGVLTISIDHPAMKISQTFMPDFQFPIEE